MAELLIRQPDDFHLHLRDGLGLESLVKGLPPVIARAIIMPNLQPPVTTTELALAYRARITSALPQGSTFEPLMTLYLTDKTSPEEIEKAHATGKVFACKLYPAGATTNSASGVTDIPKMQPVFAAMAKVGMPLCVHSEVTDKTVDIFAREPVFIDRHLTPLIAANPTLKVILEHVTTKESVAFVQAQGPNVAATITAHHLLFNRNALFEGGLQPHMYCLPVLKHEDDRQALLGAIKSGSPKFFAGTDSAPHTEDRKCMACGCAGVYTAPAAIEYYATAFESVGALDKLEAFVSSNGATFYGLPLNVGKVAVARTPWTIPATYPFGFGVVVPLMAGKEIAFKATLV